MKVRVNFKKRLNYVERKGQVEAPCKLSLLKELIDFDNSTYPVKEGIATVELAELNGETLSFADYVVKYKKECLKSDLTFHELQGSDSTVVLNSWRDNKKMYKYAVDTDKRVPVDLVEEDYDFSYKTDLEEGVVFEYDENEFEICSQNKLRLNKSESGVRALDRFIEKLQFLSDISETIINSEDVVFELTKVSEFTDSDFEAMKLKPILEDFLELDKGGIMELAVNSSPYLIRPFKFYIKDHKVYYSDLLDEVTTDLILKSYILKK